VLAFDGSFNGDTTVLTVASVDQRPHVDLVELWEAAGRQVPVVDVEQAIRQVCRRWRVLEIAADPFRWARSLQLLDQEGLPVLEYPQSPGRMTPATARFYEAVVNGQLTHSGDSRLARHIGNAVLREDARGARLAKERHDSPRRIGACMAAMMAVHRAAELAGVREPSSSLWRATTPGAHIVPGVVARTGPLRPAWLPAQEAGGSRQPGGPQLGHRPHSCTVIYVDA
jgi:hypothetical protein